MKTVRGTMGCFTPSVGQGQRMAGGAGKGGNRIDDIPLRNTSHFIVA
jgi:hypothetical protein